MFALVGVEPGASVERSCNGVNDEISGSTTSAEPVTFVGPDVVTVAGKDVDAWHFRHRHEFSGAQTGNESLDLWLAVDDFLPLRGERSIKVHTDSPVGTITDTEDGFWMLASREPER